LIFEVAATVQEKYSAGSARWGVMRLILLPYRG
jgi:hypothetical protein